jgi:hypothetical protein
MSHLVVDGEDMNALFCHEAKCCREAFASRTDVAQQTSVSECAIAAHKIICRATLLYYPFRHRASACFFDARRKVALASRWIGIDPKKPLSRDHT